jgi:hypothetical protein
VVGLEVVSVVVADMSFLSCFGGELLRSSPARTCLDFRDDCEGEVCWRVNRYALGVNIVTYRYRGRVSWAETTARAVTSYYLITTAIDR